MNLKPLHDWAVIRPSEAKERTAAGIYIPDTAKEKPQEGIVEAIGPGAFEEEKKWRKKTGEKKERRFVPTTVRPGDRVIYEQYAGQTYKIGEAERVLVRERDILGTLPAAPEPLQIPPSTTTSGPTELAKPLVEPEAKRVPMVTAGKKTAITATPKKKAAKKAKKKTTAVKKAVKKAMKKAEEKTVPVKKAVKKAVKKLESKKKAVKKAIKKLAKKAIKAAAKPVKKAKLKIKAGRKAMKA